MDINRLRKIIEYSALNGDEIDRSVRRFCAYAGMNRDHDVLNLMQIVRPSFRDKGYLVLEIPFADHEIGAFCYKGDALGYVVINTSLPKVNVNFAVCHEIYHVFFQGNLFGSKIELANDHYYEHEEEFAANLFAGMLLMPETSFRFMYHKFKSESEGNERDTIIRLMNYYQVPYMAALIRSYELGLPDTDSISEELLSVDREEIRARFVELWLDDSILEAARKDDSVRMEAVVRRVGDEYIRDGYLNERTLKKVLQNMRVLCSDIKKGE